ncbi:hypothetical protein HPB52_013845 [Rhipicephalus sanguineus]|uniref:Uncharacterized protein n=1 Tax=Rhipicephalus sanguineus TaxID=34632 RepID=A0A9D4Q077_RHISA|nr:hypothetical protein HPB52_013845 [Rhipicephalus sanguineus]
MGESALKSRMKSAKHIGTIKMGQGLKELVLQTTTYPVAAYIAPPPAAVRGVISQAYWEEASEQMLQYLQTRNPDADTIAARRMEDRAINGCGNC